MCDGSDGPRDALRRLRRCALELSEPDQAALERALEMLESTDLVAALPAATEPTLLIGNRHHRMVTRAALVATATALPDARLMLIHGAAHTLVSGHGTEFARAVADIAPAGGQLPRAAASA